MKFSEKSPILFCLTICFFIQHFSFGQSSHSLFQNSEKESISWHANSHFQLKEIDEVVHVQIDKMPWEAFSYQLENVDLSRTPFLSLKVKSDADIKLRIDILDQSLTNQITTPVVKAVPHSKNFNEILFDFSNILQTIDATQVSQLQFFVQAGKKHQGKIELKNNCKYHFKTITI